MGLQEKAQAIYQALVAFYGEPLWQPGEDPVDILIGTILSANTNDANSGRAFEQLTTTFDHNWDAIRTAPLEDIQQAIRPAGMYNQKGPAIVGALEKLYRDCKAYQLDNLATMEVSAALDYLMALPGVGHKTASIVLLFCFNRATFPVDTHVQRITQRLGLSSRRASTNQIKSSWEALLPPQTYYPLHLNLIRHGRHICQAHQPRCEHCPLQQWCDYYNHTEEWQLPNQTSTA